MLIELVVLWAIVIGTVAWFIRDERRLKAEALDRAALGFARSPHYRRADTTSAHVVEQAAALAPARRTGGLSETDRRFIKAYAALN